MNLPCKINPLGHTPNLPALFLESTGAQYIDIEYSLYPDSFVEIDAMQTQSYSQGNAGLIGGDVRKNYFALWGSMWAANRVRFDYNGNVQDVQNINTTSRFVLKKSAWQNYANGVEVTPNTEPTEPLTWHVPVVLFSCSTSSPTNYVFKGRIYSAKIGRGETLGRDFLPCVANSGAPCMYDKISKRAFFNANTAENAADFIVGMTVAQARQLWKLPADVENKTLTISLPQSAFVDLETGEIADAAVNAALAQAEAKGWVITKQYYTE